MNVKVPLIFDYLITKSIHSYSSFNNHIHVYQEDDVEHYFETIGRYRFRETSGFQWNKDHDSRSVLSEEFYYYESDTKVQRIKNEKENLLMKR